MNLFVQDAGQPDSNLNKTFKKPQNTKFKIKLKATKQIWSLWVLRLIQAEDPIESSAGPNLILIKI